MTIDFCRNSLFYASFRCLGRKCGFVYSILGCCKFSRCCFCSHGFLCCYCTPLLHKKHLRRNIVTQSIQHRFLQHYTRWNTPPWLFPKLSKPVRQRDDLLFVLLLLDSLKNKPFWFKFAPRLTASWITPTENMHESPFLLRMFLLLRLMTWVSHKRCMPFFPIHPLRSSFLGCLMEEDSKYFVLQSLKGMSVPCTLVMAGILLFCDLLITMALSTLAREQIATVSLLQTKQSNGAFELASHL